METIHPRGVAKFDPRGMAGTIYVEAISHCHIPNIKAVGPVVSEKKIFFVQFNVPFKIISPHMRRANQ